MAHKSNDNGVLEAFVGLLDALVADSLKRQQATELTKEVEGSKKGLLNRKAAAEYLDVSVLTIDSLRKKKEIKAVVIPGTEMKRYTKRSLDNLIERQSKEQPTNGITHKKAK